MASRPEIQGEEIRAGGGAGGAEPEGEEEEIGHYRLQVDRQTKAFYATEDAAEAAGLLIKKGHPVVQVSIYNSEA